MALESHQETGRLVVVEGDPGAGKTSAITSVARETDVIVVPQLDHVSDAAVPSAYDPQYPEDWYVDMERARQSDIRKLLHSGQVVLQDRWVLSTLAFVYASAIHRREPGRIRRLLRYLAQGPTFVMPDALVVMSVDVDVGLGRRSQFRQSDQYRVWFDRAFLIRFQAFYRVVGPRVLPCPTTLIDTSSLSRRSTVDALVHSYASLDRTVRDPGPRT
jgi:predicted ATPase